LSYSKPNNQRKTPTINRYHWLALSYIILSGCTRYQAPAPVYDPYAEEIASRPPLAAVNYPKIKPIKPVLKQPSTYPTKKILPIKEVPLDKPHSTPFSPAVLALISEADNRTQAGDLESAVATLERALRISPRDPSLTYKLAKLRLKQSKPRLAEDLAKKAAFLATDNRRLKKQSWQLISEARRLQRNFQGAKQAKLKADSL